MIGFSYASMILYSNRLVLNSLKMTYLSLVIWAIFANLKLATKKKFLIFEFRSGRRGSKPISSTFVSKNDDSDFVAVESPINFNKRKLSEKQKEKMREKKQEQGHIPAMYSACDNSQSRSQYLEDTQVCNTYHSERNQS